MEEVSEQEINELMNESAEDAQIQSNRIIANRKIKDTVFTSLFREPACALQFYQAIHPEDQTATEADVEIVTLQNILLTQVYNDLGILVKDRLLVLVEAQSTWSENIVVRLLNYFSQTLQEYITATRQNMYSSVKLRLPEPELYVIYTGEKKNHPTEISLSECFYGGKKVAVDVSAKVLYDGKENDIIHQYVMFAQVYQEQFHRYGGTARTVLETIRICRERDILKDYMEKHMKEAMRAMVVLNGQERAVSDYANEMWEKGKNEGISQGINTERTNGIRRMVAVLKECGVPIPVIKQKVTAQYPMSAQEAHTYFA